MWGVFKGRGGKREERGRMGDRGWIGVKLRGREIDWGKMMRL